MRDYLELLEFFHVKFRNWFWDYSDVIYLFTSLLIFIKCGRKK